MSARSDRVKAKVLAALKKNGSLLLLERQGIEGYDPALLENISADSSFQVYALPGKAAFRSTVIDGTTGVVKIGQEVMIAADVEVRIGDRIGLINGVMTTIAGLDPSIVDGQVVSYNAVVTQ